MTAIDRDATRGDLGPFLLRQLVAFLALWAVVAAWWYPAPLLLKFDEIDWGERYERAFSPSNVALGGATAAFREVVRLDSAVPPLPRWIEQETADRSKNVRTADWNGLLTAVRAEQQYGHGKVTLSARDPRLASASAALDETIHYVQFPTETERVFLEITRLRPADYGFSKAPAAVRFPLRVHWLWMLGVLSMAAAVIQLRPPSHARLAGSILGTGLKWSIGVLAAGLVFGALILLSDLGVEGIGFIMLAGFACLGGLIGFAVVGWHVRVLRRVLDGRDLLAHWVYSPDRWQQFASAEMAQRKQQRKGAFWLVIGIAAVVVAGFLLLVRDDEAAVLVVLVVAGTLALAALVVWAGLRSERRRFSQENPEAFIGTGGLWLNGITHVWRGLMARLEGAEVVERAAGSVLVITYSYLQSSGPRFLFFHRTHTAVGVPVPTGAEEEAREVVRRLTA